MPVLRDLPLADAAVSRTATFVDAARALAANAISAVAVVDEQNRVVGLFTDDDFLRGLFPGYVTDLRHTAFLRGDSLVEHARAAALVEPVERHMRKPLTVEVEASALHVAERFLHCEWGALAVVENGRFLGMVEQARFCGALLARLAVDGR